jgi:hypothetical protein
MLHSTKLIREYRFEKEREQTTKLLGSATRSLQVPGHPETEYLYLISTRVPCRRDTHEDPAKVSYHQV